ncbi:Uncharacterised protein [Mycolicibacterium aurum]|uniref:Uncharacterized protein n=1 Tax=Mycolicibacterium aurum TaxID=1791 RepID=A0A3S4VP57_MYCAU|nr:hypothetical protein [Mycolicibacterium aurum]VEG55648.1 Uncharacterised protein [Mycolicibacterium aurum]
MSDHAGQPDDGQPFDEEALVVRVAARQSAMWTRRLGYEVNVPTDRDPDEVRREVRADATATGALWFGLAYLDIGFAAAVTHASTPCDCCTDDVGWAGMPWAVYMAAARRLVGIGDAFGRVIDDPDIRAAAEMLPVCCARDRAQVELRVWRIVNRLRDILTEAEVDTLRLRCADGDNDFELRCLRAGYISALGQITGDEDMTSAAAALAIREGRERPFGGLTIPAVWCVAAPFVRRRGMDVAPDTLAALLRDELVRVDSLMVHPDADTGAV